MKRKANCPFQTKDRLLRFGWFALRAGLQRLTPPGPHQHLFWLIPAFSLGGSVYLPGRVIKSATIRASSTVVDATTILFGVAKSLFQIGFYGIKTDCDMVEAMKTSRAGIDLIKRSEGLRTQTYSDVAGLPTIGYGHKIVPPATFDRGITEATALMMLADDIESAESAVERLVTVTLSQGQFDALVDFVFNLGAGRLEHSTLLAVLNRGDYVGAGLQLLRWDHAGIAEVEGLKLRREAEFGLWQEGNANA